MRELSDAHLKRSNRDGDTGRRRIKSRMDHSLLQSGACIILGQKFNHFLKNFPKHFPKTFPNSSCKRIIKRGLFGADHTGGLFKNGLGYILVENFWEVIESGPR